MLRFFLYIIVSLIIVSATFVCVSAQAEDRFPGERSDRRREPPPTGVREMLERMRIDKEKKDYEEMLTRGTEVTKLSEQIHKSFTERGGQLSDADRDALETIDKDVRKIRNELGGSDEDDKTDEIIGSTDSLTIASAVDLLNSTTATLWDELQKSDRFSISAPAIEASNATLKLTRFLLRK